MTDIVSQEISNYIRLMEGYYDDCQRLLRFPEKKPMQCIALGRIAVRLKKNVPYTKEEINTIIRNLICFDDVETVIAGMFEFGFLGGMNDSTQFWLENDWVLNFREFMGME